MRLTTEQKINLLILAGFEPRQLTQFCSRIIRRDGRALVRRAGGEWNTESAWQITSYDEALWEDLGLDSCPDELIYEAIQS